MKIYRLIALLLLFIGILPVASFAMESDDEGYHTPVEQTGRQRKRTFDEMHSPYVPSPITDTARKRARVHSSSICKRSIRSWPSLWDEHGLDQNFIEELVIQSRIRDGKTLLHLAMGLNEPAYTDKKIHCMGNLLDGGADLLAQDNDGDTPLHCWAMCNSSTHEEITSVEHALNDYTIPAEGNWKNDQGSTPLHILCSEGLINYRKFCALARLGIPITTQNCWGQTILHRLAKTIYNNDYNKEQIIGYLSQNFNQLIPNQEAFLNTRDHKRRTALHWAVKNGDLAMFQFLVRKGIALDKRDKDGNTALHIAARQLNTRNKKAGELIRKLLFYSASKEIANDFCQRPIDLVPEKYTGIRRQLS